MSIKKTLERFDEYFYDSDHSLTPNQIAHIKKNLFIPEIERALNEVLPEEIYVPEECSSDEKTLAEIAFDRGHNQCREQIKSNISNYIK